MAGIKGGAAERKVAKMFQDIAGVETYRTGQGQRQDAKRYADIWGGNLFRIEVKHHKTMPRGKIIRAYQQSVRDAEGTGHVPLAITKPNFVSGWTVTIAYGDLQLLVMGCGAHNRTLIQLDLEDFLAILKCALELGHCVWCNIA